ncbi:hypothetical protein [Capnocytophaga sputigena]|jgi:hypothetical protein|uniref:hypothetical protein n=1 Tax=Capnocytophaga sputigena TaxID=1019 RepID=UPI0028EC2623|nr:hypothetical protein [Capnocytophaga sputigena]
MKTFQELLQVRAPKKMTLPVPLGVFIKEVKFVDIAKISPILIEGNNPDERQLLVQEIRWTMLYHKHSKNVRMFSIDAQDERKTLKMFTILQKEIAKRYKKQHKELYKVPHIIVFIKNIENFAFTHFETLKNIFEISQKVGIYFVLSIGKIEKKHYFKLLGLCNYLLIVADNLVQRANLLKITLQEWHNLYHQKINRNTIELPIIKADEVQNFLKLQSTN